MLVRRTGVEIMEKIDTFVRRLAKIGIDVKVAGNVPWIYLTHVNGKKVDELFLGNHGFTIAFYPMRHNEALRFTDIGKIFELIRRYV